VSECWNMFKQTEKEGKYTQSNRTPTAAVSNVECGGCDWTRTASAGSKISINLLLTMENARFVCVCARVHVWVRVCFG